MACGKRGIAVGSCIPLRQLSDKWVARTLHDSPWLPTCKFMERSSEQTKIQILRVGAAKNGLKRESNPAVLGGSNDREPEMACEAEE